MSIEEYIINNFKDDDLNTLRNTISECVKKMMKRLYQDLEYF